MVIDYASYERLRQHKIPEVEQTLTRCDTMLYALGVGPGVRKQDGVLNNGHAEIA